MNIRSQIIAVASLAITSAAWADEAKDGPRTGYFRKTTTPLELMGEDGARALADVFEPDQKLKWQLYVELRRRGESEVFRVACRGALIKACANHKIHIQHEIFFCW